MADEPVSTPAGPWAADLETLITDPEIRTQVDSYLRSKVQPRMTQLEQQVARAQAAQELWDAFQQNPEETYWALTEQLLGEGSSDKVRSALNPEPAATPAAPTLPAAPAQPAFDPNVMLTPEEIAQWRFQKELEAYDRAVEEILSKPENADIDAQRYHTFVAAADGNFDEAIKRYRDDTTQVLLRYGIDPEQATARQQQEAAQVAEAEQRDAAPVVMGSDAGGAGAPPPTQPQYRGMEGLHRAIDDFVAQGHRNAEAPPVA